jgi:hypothetical protein
MFASSRQRHAQRIDRIETDRIDIGLLETDRIDRIDRIEIRTIGIRRPDVRRLAARPPTALLQPPPSRLPVPHPLCRAIRPDRRHGKGPVKASRPAR